MNTDIEYDATEIDVAGTKAMILLPVVPDEAPPKVKEGIARRRAVVLEGRCPCGVTWSPTPITGGGVHHAAVEHWDYCPAITSTLVREIRRWKRRAA